MSNIVKSKEDLVVLSDTIKYIDLKELNKWIIEEILKRFMPKSNDELLIKYFIKQNGYNTACFIPKIEKIVVTITKLIDWVELNSKDMSELYELKDIDMLKKYMFIYVLVHEIEHSYQYLMAKGIIEAPNKNIELGYKGIFELFEKNNSIFPNLIKEFRKIVSLSLYNAEVDNYILERNANVECTDLLCQLALFMDREDLYIAFNKMKNAFQKIGYFNNKKGCLEETYRNILMYGKYKKFYNDLDLSNEDKIRYGFKVAEDVRKLVLKA